MACPMLELSITGTSSRTARSTITLLQHADLGEAVEVLLERRARRPSTRRGSRSGCDAPRRSRRGARRGRAARRRSRSGRAPAPGGRPRSPSTSPRSAPARSRPRHRRGRGGSARGTRLDRRPLPPPASKLETWTDGISERREVGADRLADEVGRGDARDPETVRSLGRDGRLARCRWRRRPAGRSAGRAPAASASRRSRSTTRAPSGSPSTSAATSSNRSSSTARAPVAIRSSSRLALRARRPTRPRPRRRRARGPSSPSSTGARPGRRAGAGRGSAGCIRRSPPRGASASSASSSPGATTSFAASTTRRPAGERVLGDEVDRGALQLGQVGVGLEATRARAAARRGRRGWTRRGRRRRRDGRSPAGPAVNTATRPSSGRAAGVAASAGTAPSSLAADRDHEIGDEPPVGVEVRAEVVARADDEHATVGRDRRDRRAAAVEDDDVGRGARRRGARLRRTFDTNGRPASPPPARRQPIVTTPVDGRDLEVVGGGVAAGA